MYCQKCGAQVAEGTKFCASCGHEIGAPVQPVFMPASMGKRFLNLILDRLFAYMGVFLIIGFAALAGTGDSSLPYIIGIIIGVLFYLVGYHLLFETVWQRTPAKWITGTKVVREDGTKAPFLTILGRTLARRIPFEALSYLFGRNPNGWHDRLSHTLVVPSEYTADNVKKIDLKAHKQSTSTRIVVIILVLLFVIAGVGILATIVLTSLGSAREKANDVKTEASLSSARVQAELYYSNNQGSYTNVCTDPNGIKSLLESTIHSTDSETYVCNDTKTAWAASVPLNSGNYVCTDSTGVAKETSEAVLAGETACK
jgi:uncharacterized RDD family membrane protein YckC/type II secretory pathway pseudopilin PulG